MNFEEYLLSLVGRRLWHEILPPGQNSGHTPCSFGHTFHTYASVAMSLLCPKKRIPSGLLWNSMTLP